MGEILSTDTYLFSVEGGFSDGADKLYNVCLIHKGNNLGMYINEVDGKQCS